MIRFAYNNEEDTIKQLWKSCFGDIDEYIDFFFAHKYNAHNTLVYEAGNKIVASLQMIPYTITFYGKEIPFAYIAGACTLPQYRKLGYMDALLKRSFAIMKERHIPLSILIPEEDWLYRFYEKYDYQSTFEEDTKNIDLKHILDKYDGDRDKCYLEYAHTYLKKDFCVQHDKDDFEAIIEEYIYDEYPPKSNLAGMSKIIDFKILLDLFAQRYPLKDFNLCVNGTTFAIRLGKCQLTDKEADLKIDAKLVCRLLFGFKLTELDPSFTNYFEPHQPSINLMLE